MAKKSKQSWKSLLKDAGEKVGGNDSFLWKCPTGDWHPLNVRPATIKIEDADGDDDWKVVADVEMQHPLSNGEWVREEIPFWAWKAFEDELEDADEDDDEILIDFKRRKDGKVNSGKFRLIEEE